MQESMNNVEFFRELELENIHQETKNQSLAKVCILPSSYFEEKNTFFFKCGFFTIPKFLEKPRLGGAELTSKFVCKIEDGVEEKFVQFKLENKRKFEIFIVSI